MNPKNSCGILYRVGQNALRFIKGLEMEWMEDYSGPFDPTFSLAHLSRKALARLGREYLMMGHVHDRALMPILASRFGAEAMTEVAIDEWMGSSPIYNERNRRSLGVVGDGVSSIFKGLQLDVGAPHQYMDFRYELVDESEGYFWLDYCGALADVSAMAGGREEPIIQMCHHMEDPTFDATVMAVNSGARCRPVFRPPLEKGHTGPVCRWQVKITDARGVVEERDITRAMRETLAATFEFTDQGEPSSRTGGLDDYAGDFLPDFVLEDLSHRSLVRQCKEFALDLHLLVWASHLSILDRFGETARAEVAREHWAGAAPIYVERIRAALGMKGDDMEAILKMLQVDPALPHEYIDFGCHRSSADLGQFWIHDCPGLREGPVRGWLSLLDDFKAPGFDAVVASVNPRARCRPIDPESVTEWSAGRRPDRAWEIVLDESVAPREESRWAAAGRVSTVYRFKFVDKKI